ncbi:MAG TPA: PA14 domain-containing protein [Alphaproteobacteria bacterium]|nr:PA14 domain-containing protein [Alphaproteobacteria bacterium]
MPVAGLALLLAVAGVARADEITGLKPATPQPAAAKLTPGLAVEYLYVLVRHVDEAEAAGKGHPAAPLPMLNYHSGDGKVLGSDEKDGVAARIRGFIHFDQAGTYLLAMQSNDGVRLKISDTVVIEDPDVHPDRFSPNVPVKIAQPGWYPLYLMYFERRNTSTLELYWQPPGASEFSFVPAEAFAHLKSDDPKGG